MSTHERARISAAGERRDTFGEALELLLEDLMVVVPLRVARDLPVQRAARASNGQEARLAVRERDDHGAHGLREQLARVIPPPGHQVLHGAGEARLPKGIEVSSRRLERLGLRESHAREAELQGFALYCACERLAGERRRLDGCSGSSGV